jgi:hypothetical protein
MVSRIGRGRAARAVFPPEQVAEVKAMACELPATHGLPLSRFSRAELHRLVIERGITDASASTIWRWLAEDAIKPWQTRSWIFRRDPDFREKAGRALDLYQHRFDGKLLHPGEFVISADEKSQLQALGRRQETEPPRPGRSIRYEFEYRRGGTLAYLAAWDVHHARLFDRVEPTTGIEPFGRLVEQVMSTEPYASARRVFWIVDNGSSHAGKASINRLQGRWRNLRLIHLPVHASWLNQIEIYCSILQRKALTRTTAPRSISSPNDCWRSAATTARSPGRSNGPSPAAISSACSNASTRTSSSATRPAVSYGWPPDYAASRIPPGVLATPTRTATASSNPARRNRREPLPRSTSAAAASIRSTTPASARSTTARARRARSSAVSSFSTTASSNSGSGSSSHTASARRSSSGENTFGSATCNDRSTAGSPHNSSNNTPNSLSGRLRSLAAAARED